MYIYICRHVLNLDADFILGTFMSRICTFSYNFTCLCTSEKVIKYIKTIFGHQSDYHMLLRNSFYDMQLIYLVDGFVSSSGELSNSFLHSLSTCLVVAIALDRALNLVYVMFSTYI